MNELSSKSLSLFPAESRRNVRVLLTDIDDTLTSGGRLTADAYGAMERLQKSGLLVIPVTGRPAGWCDHIARMWPVDGVVGENGAFYMRYDHDARTMRRHFAFDTETRRSDRLRLDRLKDTVLAAVPGTAPASDQNYRDCDLAIDHCEDVPALSSDDLDTILRLADEAGAVAKVSSIHVNCWFGDHDKLTMSRTLLADGFGIDVEREADQIVFAGDSPNDESMFAFFPLSVGVANVRAFAGRMNAEPAYVTDLCGGAGFAELADSLLAAR